MNIEIEFKTIYNIYYIIRLFDNYDVERMFISFTCKGRKKAIFKR